MRNWLGDSEILENLEVELADQIRRIYDLGLAGQFRTYCQIPGAGTEDYKNAWLELPDDGWALCGIRFRGLDLQRPFVDLVGSSRLNGPPEGIEPIVRAAEERYRVFRPLHLRVFVAGHRSALASQIPDAFVERGVFARPVSQLRAAPLPVGMERVALRRTDVADLAHRLQVGYEDLQSQHPEHKEHASAASLDDLQYYDAEGVVFEVVIDGKPAGVVAAYRDVGKGMAGFQVGEIFLYEGWRGQGLGPAALRALIEALPAREDDVLFGEIDSRNVPARKTAESSGRVGIGYYVWIALGASRAS